jgi:sugar phosphate isomerase/epimerase
MDRRSFLKSAPGAALAGGLIANAGRTRAASRAGDAGAHGEGREAPKRYQNGRSPWPISLDGATVGWPKLETFVEVAAKAGYDAIEPWMRQLEQYEQDGGDLKALGQRIAERGMFVPSIIGLWDAIPTERSAFEKSLKATRRRMGLAQKIGARHVQTIPAKDGQMDLDWAGEAYRRILDIGLNDHDLTPALVFVEMFTIKTLRAATYAALAADHPAARIIPDTFHMHISGSGLSGVGHLSGDFIAILQFNDAPAEPARDQLNDGHRVMPGDGILPLQSMLQDLHRVGFDRAVSVELYNRKYQQMDALKAAKLGLDKTVAVIDAAV